MKNKGMPFIIAGVIGGALIISYDPLMKKPVNDFTGPISTPMLIACGLLIIIGIFLLLKNKPAPKKAAR
jgi:hypothetical protein